MAKFLSWEGLQQLVTSMKSHVASVVGNYYTKSEIDTKVSNVENKITALGSVLNFKGTKATKSDLPASGSSTGDVWHVTEKSAEYVWTGSAWEELGSTIDLSGYALKSHTHTASQITDFATEAAKQVSITSVKVNGTALTPTSKSVNITVTEGTANGTVKVNGTDVSVHGLGTAAYTASSAYATAAQGAKADTALQPNDMVAITNDEIISLF